MGPNQKCHCGNPMLHPLPHLSAVGEAIRKRQSGETVTPWSTSASSCRGGLNQKCHCGNPMLHPLHIFVQWVRPSKSAIAAKQSILGPLRHLRAVVGRTRSAIAATQRYIRLHIFVQWVRQSESARAAKQLILGPRWHLNWCGGGPNQKCHCGNPMLHPLPHLRAVGEAIRKRQSGETVNPWSTSASSCRGGLN